MTDLRIFYLHFASQNKDNKNYTTTQLYTVFFFYFSGGWGQIKEQSTSRKTHRDLLVLSYCIDSSHAPKEASSFWTPLLPDNYCLLLHSISSSMLCYYIQLRVGYNRTSVFCFVLITQLAPPNLPTPWKKFCFSITRYLFQITSPAVVRFNTEKTFHNQRSIESYENIARFSIHSRRTPNIPNNRLHYKYKIWLIEINKHDSFPRSLCFNWERWDTIYTWEMERVKVHGSACPISFGPRSHLRKWLKASKGHKRYLSQALLVIRDPLMS